MDWEEKRLCLWLMRISSLLCSKVVISTNRSEYFSNGRLNTKAPSAGLQA